MFITKACLIYKRVRVGIMVFNATFNNTSVTVSFISGGNGVPVAKHRLAETH